MATYDEAEVSQDEGRPLELYEILVEGVFFRFTNGERTIEKGGFDFEPTKIARENVEQSSKQISGQFQLNWGLRNNVSASFLQLWLSGAPEDDAKVTIFKQHVGATGFNTFWAGEIRDVSFRPNQCQMILSNVGSFFTDKGPRLDWGGHCGNNFGDELCTFDVGSVTRTLTVASIAADGITVTVTDLSSGQTDGDYVRGELRKGGFRRRYIAQHVGDVVTLLYPMAGLAAGDQVEMVEGCPHNTDACDSRFSNIEHYSGAPYTPNVNPFERDLNKV